MVSVCFAPRVVCLKALQCSNVSARIGGFTHWSRQSSRVHRFGIPQVAWYQVCWRKQLARSLPRAQNAAKRLSCSASRKSHRYAIAVGSPLPLATRILIDSRLQATRITLLEHPGISHPRECVAYHTISRIVRRRNRQLAHHGIEPARRGSLGWWNGRK